MENFLKINEDNMPDILAILAIINFPPSNSFDFSMKNKKRWTMSSRFCKNCRLGAGFFRLHISIERIVLQSFDVTSRSM
jgi:hypothetical protein